MMATMGMTALTTTRRCNDVGILDEMLTGQCRGRNLYSFKSAILDQRCLVDLYVGSFPLALQASVGQDVSKSSQFINIMTPDWEDNKAVEIGVCHSMGGEVLPWMGSDTCDHIKTNHPSG